MSQYIWYPPKSRTKELDKQVGSNKSAPHPLDDNPYDFLKKVSDWIRKLALVGNYTAAYLSDWIWIATQYRIHHTTDSEAYSIARSYLITLEKLLANSTGKLGPFLADFHWLTDSAISQLTSLLGKKTSQSYLSDEEMIEIENRISELCELSSPLSNEEQSALEEYRGLFSDVESDTYYPGISEMLQTLIDEANAGNGHSTYATACLRYVIEPEDVVPDTLGYIGLVDDLYAIDKGCHAIRNQKTWTPLLKNFNKEWPFLNSLTFLDSRQSIRLPTLLRFVGGSALNAMSSEGSKSCIVLPEVGPCGLIASFLAAIQSLQTQASSCTTASQQTFEIGDDLLLRDSATTLRVRYGGKLEYGNQTFHTIELSKDTRIAVDDQTLSYASRPAKPHTTLSPPKEFHDWKDACTPPLLCNIIGEEFDRKAVTPEVLLLTQKTKLDQNVKTLRPMNTSIPEMVGVTYVTSSGNEESLSGTDCSGSLIWACSDYFTAKELLETEDCTIKHIVSDTPHSLLKLEEAAGEALLSKKTLTAICGIYEMEEIRELQRNGYLSWLLRDEDISIVSDYPDKAQNPGPIKKYQAKQALQGNVKKRVHTVQCAEIDNILTATQTIREENKTLNEPYLDIIVLAAMRFVRNFSKFPLEFDEIEERKLLDQLLNLQKTCATVADYNAQALTLLKQVNEVAENWPLGNPKEGFIQEIIAPIDKSESTAVICKSSELAEKYTRTKRGYPGKDHIKWATLKQLRDIAPIDKVIVPTWLDKTSMRELRCSGYARSIDMVLYDFEADWEKCSQNAATAWQRKLSSTMSNQWDTLEKKYGPIEKPTCISPQPAQDSPLPSLDIDVGDEQLSNAVVQRIRDVAYSRSNESETAKGQLVTFEDSGSYMFLPPNGSVISLTKFLEATSGINSADFDAERLVSCPVSEVRAGDLLAFSAHRASDLIDDLANRLIRNHTRTRETANLWRRALQGYLEEGGTLETLRLHLAANGLVRHPVTIRGWIYSDSIIAPLQYKKAINSIASTTKHQELNEKISQVLKAVETIYSARTKAAGEFLKEIASKDLSFAEGKANIEFEGHEITYRLHRVLTIDSPQDVPAHDIGKIITVTDEIIPQEALN